MPDSALVKEYLLRKLNEGSGFELVGIRRWAMEGRVSRITASERREIRQIGANVWHGGVDSDAGAYGRACVSR